MQFLQKFANRFPLLWSLKKFINSSLSKAVIEDFLDDIKDKNKRLILIYDCKTTPPTIGDFTYLVVLIRYLVHQNRKVSLFIVNSEYRDDWKVLESQKINLFLKQLEVIVHQLVQDKSFNFQICSWSNELIKKLESPEVSILFSNYVFSRDSFYHLIPNLLNGILENEQPHLIKKVLFSVSDFPIIKKTLPSKYVTVIVRSASSWGSHRDTTLEDFIRTVKAINKKMPDSEIVVVSDQTTCNYFREENKTLDLSCSFSKDYSSSLLEDVSIILGGIFCFQLNAGGICVYPIFSELPYLFVMDPGNYDPWSKKSLTSFANSDQFFIGTTRKEVFFESFHRI